MIRILNEKEREQIRLHFGEGGHPLYEVCEELFKSRSAHLDGLRIGTEEIFCATASMLDTLFRTENINQETTENLWLTLFNDIRYAEPKVTEHDKMEVAHTVFAIVQKLMCHRYDTRYAYTLYDMLSDTIKKETALADQIANKEIEKSHKKLFQFSQQLDDWINQYGENGSWLSEQIEECFGKTKPAKPQSAAKPKKKPSGPPKGKHKAFPFISKVGTDSYRMAQVADLCAFMNKTRADGGPMLTKADQRAFINNFTTGNTSATILWLGTKRQLHFIVSEWKRRKYITFDSDDDIWVITSGVFINGKGVKKDGQPVPFDSDDLGSTHNPENITQDLEDIVEMLNPEKPSKNFERFVQKEEERIGYQHKAKARKSYQEEEDDPYQFTEFWEEQNGK